MASMRVVRQGLVICTIACNSILMGYLVGQYTGMASEFHGTDGTIKITPDNIALIGSLGAVVTVSCYPIPCILLNVIGRKKTASIGSCPSLIACVLLYGAGDFPTILFAAIFMGLSFSSYVTYDAIIIAEYTNPNTRGIILNMMTAVVPILGIMLGHLCNWYKSLLIASVPSVLSIVLPWFWLESPTWLASKGRFRECAENFQALHGSGMSVQKELQLLIEIEKAKLEKVKTNRKNFKKSLRKVLLLIRKDYFIKVVVVDMFTCLYRCTSGKMLFFYFAVDMLQEITNSSDVFLFSLIVDTLLLSGSILSCFIIRFCKMRTLLFTTGIVSNIVILIFCACSYFNSKESKNIILTWVSVCLLGLYYVFIDAGAYTVLESVVGELFPTECKSLGIGINGVMMSVFLTTFLNISPILLSSFGVSGTFTLFSLMMCISLLYLYFHLPETKGKTLQEIELFFKNINARDYLENINNDDLEINNRILS